MDNNLENIYFDEIQGDDIKSLIYNIRGRQVMIDSDLARLYQVKTKRLNEQVRRNIKRFPEEFRFQLTDRETYELVANCDRLNPLKHSSNNPYCFTESGIAMLSSVLKSDIAIKVSIKIMSTFVEMRKFLIFNQELYPMLNKIELRLVETDIKLDENEKKFKKIFDYISETKEVSQKVFFDGQIYDAYSLLVGIVKRANKSIILVDNFVDTITLDILSKRKENIKINIYTSKKEKLTDTEVFKFNNQYGGLAISYIETFHDRFMILDEEECYHIGTSIKDAGSKSFAITKILDAKTIESILDRLTLGNSI